MYLKIVQDSYVTSDGTAALKLRITIRSKVTYLPLDIRVKPEHFNAKSGQVRSGNRNSQRLNSMLQRKMSEVYDRLLELKASDRISHDTLKHELIGGAAVDAYDFIGKIVESYKHSQGTYKARKAAMSKLKDFAPTLRFADITPLWLRRYDAWMVDKRQAAATRFIALKFIRYVCNMAISERLISQNPFEKFTMPTGMVRKEGLTSEELQRFVSVPLEGLQAFSRDVFLIQLHCLGMRIGDVLTLKTEQIEGGTLRYKMAKTGDELRIDLTDFVLSKVDNSKTYVLNWRGWPDYRDRVFIEAKTALINKTLKQIAKAAGIDKPISSKFARLTWTQLAKEKSGGNMRLLQDALGHESISTTEIYAGGRNFTAVNELNRKMWE